MALAPAQPDRPLAAAMCADAAATLVGSGAPLATYLREGRSPPGDGEDALPAVRVEIVVRAPGLGSGGGGGTRVGPTGFGAGGLSAASAPGRVGRTGRVRLARLAPGTDVSEEGGADRGVLDPGDGFGGRVVRLAAGDKLFVPGEIVGSSGEDACLTVVGPVACDDGNFLAEVSVS